MTDTTSAQMIDPEVFADMVSAKFTGKLVVGQFASTANSLEGQPGSTITFPKWAALSDMSDVAEDADLVPEQLGTSDDDATIKEAGKAVAITDRALLVGLGDPLGEAASQFATLAARKVDADLVAEAGSTASSNPLIYDGSGNTLTSNALVSSLALFGDDAEPSDFDGIVIHSRQRADIFRDPDFVHVSEIGDNSIRRRGMIGTLYGLPVFISDRVTKISTVYSALILRKGALGLIYKRRPIVEQARDILGRKTILTTNVHYAVKRLNDAAVCVLKTTVGSIEPPESAYPGAPAKPTVTPGDEQASVAFVAPVDTGSSAIVGYVVRAYVGGTVVAEVVAASSPATVTELVNDVAHTFTVAAVNSAGEGPESPHSDPATPAS